MKRKHEYSMKIRLGRGGQDSPGNKQDYHVNNRIRFVRTVILSLLLLLIPFVGIMTFNVFADAADNPYPEVQTYIKDVSEKNDIDVIDNGDEPNVLTRVMSMVTGDFSEQTDLQATDYSMFIKYTFVNANAVDDEFSIYDKSGKFDEALVAQTTGSSIFYDTDTEYYATFVSPNVLNDSGKVIDWCIAYQNNNAQIIDTAWYDEKSGMAYVPKSVFTDDIDEVQIQLIIPFEATTNNEETVVDVNINNAIDDNNIASTEIVNAYNMDTSVVVPVVTEDKDKFSASDFDVYVNGESTPLVSDNYTYDANTGEIAISGSPTSILSLDVTVKSQTPSSPNSRASNVNWGDTKGTASA